jgi:glycosyltransferase involved in cell wall biosynthesis
VTQVAVDRPGERSTRRLTPVGRRGRQLRVAQVVTRFTAGAGGIALRGATALDPERYRTTILTAEGGSLIGAAEGAGLEVVRLRHLAGGRGIYPGNDLRGLRELERQLAAGGFDLVHTHSAKAGALGRIAAHRIGVPAVHTFHGFPFHEFQSPPTRALLVEIERRLGRLTSFFLASGTTVAADAVRRRNAPPARLRAVATVPLDEGIRPRDAASRARGRRLAGVPDDVPLVGTVARLDGQKAPHHFVRAIALLGRPDVHAVWVGAGPLQARAAALAERLGLAGRFHLLGERDDVAAILPAFDVFALSSLYEGLPCALVEAMTCGVPVVATAVNSVSELVVPGETGLLARPGDPRSLARALALLLDRPEEADRLAAAASRHVATRYRASELGAALATAYASVLARAGDRGGR